MVEKKIDGDGRLRGLEDVLENKCRNGYVVYIDNVHRLR
jgi:hypothetical protein